MELKTFARSLCVVGLSLSAAVLQAENIKGRILDKQTGEPLVGALVKVAGSSQGAVTDADGNYLIKGIAPGIYTLEVTYIGYASMQVTDVQVAGKELTLDLKMDGAAQELGEVRRSLNEAYRQFNTVTDDVTMDACIFEISALKSKYNCAVRNLKSLYL